MPRNWLQKVCDQLSPATMKKVERRPRGRLPARVEPLEVRSLLAAPVIPGGQTFNNVGENIGVNLAAPYVDPVTGTSQANTINGTVIGTLSASDPEGETLQYTIPGVNGTSPFAINANTGQITVNNFAAINFENSPSFTITVNVRDVGAAAPATTAGTFVVNLVNRNDIPFIQQNQTFTVPENSVAGTPLTGNGGVVTAFTAINQNAGSPTAGLDPNNPNLGNRGTGNVSGQSDTNANGTGDNNINTTLRYQILGASSSTTTQGVTGTTSEVQRIIKPTSLSLGGKFVLGFNSTLPVTQTTQGTGAVDEVQTLDMGAFPNANKFFTLTFNGQTTKHLHYNSTSAEVQSELQLLSTIGGGNVTVTPGGGNGAPWVITFVGQLSKTNVNSLSVTAYTDALGYNAGAPAIQTALNGLPTVGAGNVSVATFTVGSNNGWDVTFQNALGDVNQISVINQSDLFTISSDIGGANPTLARLTVSNTADPYFIGSRADGQTGLVSGVEFLNNFFGTTTIPVLVRVQDMSSVNAQGTNVLNPNNPTLSYDEYVFVTITDQSEAAPAVTDKTFTVPENSPSSSTTPTGTVIGKVNDPLLPFDVTSLEQTLSPLTGKSFSYNIVGGVAGGNVNNAFAINSVTSEITVANASALDWETKPTYRLLIRVTDNASPNLATIAAMDINLTDVNEPTSIPDGQAFNVAEAAPVGTQLGKVRATDLDLPKSLNVPTGYVFTYEITNGNLNNTFAIDPATGIITVANNAFLNAATHPSFTLGVRVIDRDLQLSSAVNTVQINVVPANTVAPIINDATFPINESPSSVAGTFVGNVTATTVGATQTITSYSIVNAGTPFGIDNMGNITVINPAALDFEAQSSWTLVVKATDNTTPIGLFSTAIVTIFVNDINEQIVLADQTRTVAEDAVAGTNVGAALTVSDPDDNDNVPQGKIYKILSGNIGSVFAINGSSGQITVANPANLNYEARSSYGLIVQVTDTGSPATAAIATVTVNVTNANDAPVINDQTLPSVIEHRLPNTTVVGTVIASDQDVGQTLRYDIIGGNVGGAFAIDPVSGQVTIANSGAVDFSQNPIFQLLVQVTDAQGSSMVPGGLIDTAIVTINVLDADAPIINDVVMSVPENSVVTTVVGNVNRTGGTGPFSYSIAAAGNLGNTFSINANGDILVANLALLNFETNPVFTLVVTVIDSGNPQLTDNATITINVTDLNELPTVNNPTFSLPENTANLTVVGSVTASDPDVGQTLSYMLTSGNTGGAFAVNPANGQITVANVSALNFEVNPVFNLVVAVSDGVGAPVNSNVTINLTDINEAPVITSQMVSINENSPNNTTVATFTAANPDAAQTVSYAITAGNNGTFDITSSGVVFVKDTTLLNFEATPSYSLTIVATDNGSAVPPNVNTSTATLTINVNDLNELPTVNNPTFTLPENSPVTTVVGSVTATDPDVGQTLSYTIMSGNTGSAFSINSSGQISVATASAVNFETNPVFNLVVAVSDGVGAPVNSNVTINLTDINEAPAIGNQTVGINENMPNGTVVATFTAVNPESSQTVTYAITAGNNGTFTINPTTGVVTVADTTLLNFEATPNYSLTIVATDTGSGTAPNVNTSTATLTINVNNLNELPTVNNPMFTIPENTSVGTVVGGVTASDPDVGQTLSYTITSGNTGNGFQINSATGVITVQTLSAINFETNPVFNLVVAVSDGVGAPVNSNVTINLTDINEAPLIGSQTVSVNENSPNGTVVATFTAANPESSQTVTYAITAGNDGTFTINPATGVVTVANSALLNFEATPTYSLTIVATDTGSGTAPNVNTSTVTLTVNVGNLNELPSVNNPTFTIAENTPVGTVVGGVTATDPDVGQTLSYTITSGNTGNAFQINSATGVITVKTLAAVNFETNPVFNLVVAVSDGVGAPVNSNVTINLTDINEAPTIGNQTVGINENMPNGTVVATFTAANPDASQTVSYAITAGNNGTFTINPTTGVVTVANSALLNFEATPTYSLTIVATDSGSGTAPNVNTSTATLTVNVNDLNELPTVNNPTFTIPENTPVGTVVGGVTASDPDAGQTLSYTITSGNTGSAFQINSATGVITVKTLAAINFEVNPVFNLVVAVSDGVGAPVNSNVTINLTNVQEAPVVTPATVMLAENSPVGTSVHTVVASDDDVGQSLTYAITGGNVNNTFTINSTTGEITVADSTRLDYENQPPFLLQVTVTDNGTPALSGVATIVVKLTDVNDAPHVYNAAVAINENPALGATLLDYTIVASDRDRPAQTLTYAIIAGNTGAAFAINSSTGLITVANPAAVDFETNPSFNLTIQVSDNGAPPLTSTAQLVVTVNNVNDAPVIANKTVTLPENSPVGTVVVAAGATDQDAGQTLTYAITAGNQTAGGGVQNVFAINPTTGVITVANPAGLDWENQPPFNLTVSVTDSGNPALTSTAVMTVVLTNVNDAPSVYDGFITRPENMPVGTLVLDYKIVAKDQDAGQTLTYAITAGNTGNAFSIDPSTGLITVNNAAAIDFETNPVFNLTMLVTDNGTPVLSSTANLRITLTNLNDAPVVPPQTFTLPENSPLGTIVGTVVANDGDAGQTRTFAITAGNTANAFTINASTGEIRVNNAAAIDFEVNPFFNLTVSATDNGSPAATGSGVVTVNLQNVNDAPTILPQTFTVAENSAAGVVVGSVVATEADAGQSVTYAITAGNTLNAFSINAQTGVLSVSNPQALNYEASPQFLLTVRVIDNGQPAQQRSATVTVNLTNVNEAPKFAANNPLFTIPENMPVGTLVGTSAATDPDAGTVLTYAIVSGNNNGAFSIDNAGNIRVANPAAIDFESGLTNFTLGITATDNGNPALQAATSVAITILNANDAPVVQAKAFTIFENSAAGASIGTIVATDQDPGQTRTFSITGGNVNGAFVINPTTGALTVGNAAALDFETTPVFNLTVTAADNGSPVKSGSATVTVNLLDKNEPPVVPSQQFTVRTGAANATVVGTVVATDPDAGQTRTYAIVGGNGAFNNIFSINATTGQLRVNNRLGILSNGQQYNLQIRVTDNGSPALSSVGNVKVVVSNTGRLEAPVAATTKAKSSSGLFSFFQN